MNIRDVMTTKVETIAPEATVYEAAMNMQKCDIGCLPVCRGDQVEGIITDRDIVTRVLAQGKDPGATAVHDAMTKHVQSVFANEDISVAALRMENEQIRRLLVVDDDHRIVGIVSLGDLATCMEDLRSVGRTLEGISESA